MKDSTILKFDCNVKPERRNNFEFKQILFESKNISIWFLETVAIDCAPWSPISLLDKFKVNSFLFDRFGLPKEWASTLSFWSVIWQYRSERQLNLQKSFSSNRNQTRFNWLYYFASSLSINKWKNPAAFGFPSRINVLQIESPPTYSTDLIVAIGFTLL